MVTPSSPSFEYVPNVSWHEITTHGSWSNIQLGAADKHLPDMNPNNLPNLCDGQAPANAQISTNPQQKEHQITFPQSQHGAATHWQL
jgi:hypothetical protein